MNYINRKMIWMNRMLFLPVSIMLFLASGILYGQASVHLESGGFTIDVICEISGTYQFIGTNWQHSCLASCLRRSHSLSA